MTDIVDFLTARLDEDEAAATFLTDDRQWTAGSGNPRVSVGDGFAWASTIPTGVLDCDDPGDDCSDYAGLAWRQQAHIARHDPARVLAEVAAKRRIVRTHTPTDAPWCPRCDAWPCVTLRALAGIHAGHPDYDPAWAVQ